MGLILRRRKNIGGGLGVNFSKSGLSSSVRTKAGSLGTTGFSIRTGIPGLYIRNYWGKKHSGIFGKLIGGFFWFFFLFPFICFKYLLKLIVFVTKLFNISKERHLAKKAKEKHLEILEK